MSSVHPGFPDTSSTLRVPAVMALAPGFGDFSSAFGAWSRVGVWLTLWDDGGRPVIESADVHPFWRLLRGHSERFQSLLAALASRTPAMQPACIPLESYGGIEVICLPIRHRGRGVGAILGCAVTDAFMEEETFARFCSLHQLDRAACARLAGALPRHPRETLAGFLDILQTQFEALGGQVTAVREVHDLSTHLAQAYEELNLIYRVSSNLTVLKRPAVHFEEVCRELLDVTVVRAFAVLLEPPGATGAPHADAPADPARSAASAAPEDAPQVILGGPSGATERDLIRLYRQVDARELNAGAALVINQAACDAGLSWASGWLRQLVYWRLERQGRRYGGLLALNHADGKAFGSQEIQLIEAVVERSLAFLENVRLYEDLEQLFMGMLHALVSSIDAKDPYTRGHSQRVAWLSRHLAERFELSEARCRRVYLGGLLHDVGKIGISEQVLRKTGRLSEEEFAEMKRHPEIGARILQAVRQIEDVIPGVLQHHERYDGRGYPRGLSGESISLMGRIIGLADSFDAMTTSRTYRTAHPLPIALAEIRRGSGTQFDPRLADLLLRDDPARLLRTMSEREGMADFGLRTAAG